MTSPENPDNDKNGDDSEVIEAEIVESDDHASSEETRHVEAETVIEDESVSSDEKKPNLVTPGVVLMGVMALALIIVFLNQGTSDRSEVAVATMQEIPEQVVDILAGPEPEIASKVENTTAATLGANRPQLADNSDAVITPPMPIEEASPADNNVELAAGDDAEEPAAQTNQAAAEQRRLAAIERARQRREARNTLNDDGQVQSGTEITTREGNISPPVSDTSVQNIGDNAELGDAGSEELPVPVTSVGVAGQEEPAVVVSDAVLADQLEVLKDDVKADVLAEVAVDKSRLARQEEEISQLRQELDAARIEQARRAEQLEARLNTIQNNENSGATRKAALSLAVTNLQRQMSTGRPFAEQLTVLEQLSPGTSGVRELKPFAETGLPTLSALQLSYSDAARKALAAAKRADSEGPLAKLGANFSSLFSVRKVGMVEGDNPSAIISRAEVSLEEGDLTTCLKELGGLENGAADVMADWIAEARSHVAADQLVDEISNRILATL